MCGFVGGVFRRPVSESDARAFTGATDCIAHRGPDDEGLAVVPAANAVLAFRRLSIVDLEGGAQPMATGSGQHIIFNGEIYNFQALRQDLIESGVRLRTRSDTEALLWTLTDKGADGVHDLVGMFGFAFVDTERRYLLLARDRLGVKQVYYTETPEGFFFASEPKALLALPWVTPALDTDRLPEYFAFRATPAPNTLFKGVNKLHAGETLRLDLHTWERSLSRYWPAPEPTPTGDGIITALDRFEESFLASVERRLIADVPVGAFLSGGLDSSLVVAAMRKLGHDDIATFSATFPGSADDEATFARRVSRRFGTRHYEHPASPGEFLAALDQWVSLNDDLVADASCLPLLGVSRLARKSGYIVLLSGEGADELFAGYGSYHKFVALNRMHRWLLTGPARRAMLGLMERSRVLSPQDRPRAAEYLVRGGGFMGTAALLGRSELESYLDQGLRPAPALERAASNRMADLLAFDFRTRIPEDLMVRTDRATMGASIETRVPFLDPDVVTTAFSLAPWHRSAVGVGKLLLRLLALRWGVPRQTVYHRKIGFQIPTGEWFRNELAPVWRQILAERAVPGISYDQVERVYRDHEARRGQHEEILWRVAALEFWYRRWIADSPIFERSGLPGPEEVTHEVA